MFMFIQTHTRNNIQRVRYILYLKRKPLYYIVNLVIPVMLKSAVSFLVFLYAQRHRGETDLPNNRHNGSYH